MTAQILEIAGRKMAVMPIDEYERLIDAAEDNADELAAADAERRRLNGEEYIPSDLIDRIFAGENPIRVWRKFRSLSQEELAARIGTTVATISRMESGKQGADPKRWRSLAHALGVTVEDIFPD